MMAEDQGDTKDGVIQMSVKSMEDLLLSLNPDGNESFSRFHSRVQHLELSLTHSPTDKPWESLFACILQQLLHCTGCDDLEDIVQQAGKYWARLQVKINEIIRSSSRVLNKTITCEEISKTIQNKSNGVQNYIEDFLQFLHDHFNTNVKLSFFEWRALSITHFRCPDLEKSPKEEHVILVMDPDLNCFRLLTPVLDSGSSIDDYFEELFNQIIQRQEMHPYFIKKFDKLDTPDFQTWVDSQFEILTQVASVVEFPKFLLPDYDQIVPLSNFPLLEKYFDAVQPSTKEEILQSLKRYYILTVENASKVVLETRIAQHKDKYVRRIEKEEELQRQNNQLDRDYKTAQELKQKYEFELQNYLQNMEADKATKKRQEEIIRQREQDIAKSEDALIQKRCLLAWNFFRKDLMEVNFSYKTLQQVSQVHSNSSKPLVELCEDVLNNFQLPFFTNKAERENLLLYIANNNTPETKAEITDILSFLFQPPKIAFNVSKNETLEVSGRHLIVSELLKSIIGYQFKELRLAAGLTIYLDANFPQERFHGISIVMSAPTIEVIKLVTINTSGNSGDPQCKLPKASNGDYNGRNGTDGEDGAAGESAGHVYLQTSKWEFSRNLTIIANGGDGGFGQDGGDGRDGDSGRDGVDGDSEANWKNQSDRSKYIDRGTKGDRGDKGGDGGRAGLGGEGGNKGIVLTSENFCGTIIANEGCQGEDGRSGAGGRGGPGGYDGTDHGCAWHNYSFMFGEWKYARGELDVRKQDVWYGGNGWDLITRRSESEVRSCQACRGGEGSTGKDSSNRASRRNKTDTKNDICQNEIFAMSKAVRTLYNHRDLASLTRETAALKTDQALEAQMSNLRNLKSDEMSENDEIDAKLEKCQKKIDHAVELQTKLESEMAGTKSRQRDVCHHLKKVALEKQSLNSIIDTTEGVANQLKKTFLAQRKFQNQAKQQLQATLTKEFDSTSLQPETTQQVISEDIQINKDTWIAQYKDIHNLMDLPDEVLPVVLASRFSNKESAHAFEIGLQSVVSSQTLSPKAKGFVEQIFKSFRSDTTSSSVRYFNNYLSADVDIVQQTDAWSGISHKERDLIFYLDRNYRRKSLEDFLIHLRNSRDFVHPGKVQSFQNNIDELNKRNFSEHGKLMLDHLSTIMVDFMETWLLMKCRKHYSMYEIPESPESTSVMLNKVRCIYLEAKQYIPKLRLQEVYSNFLGINTSAKREMQDKDIWHEFVLFTTHIKPYSYLTTVLPRKSDLELIENALEAIQGSLSKSSSRPDVFENLKILLLVFRYANLLPDQLQKLVSLCDEISCIILQPNENIFFEFQQVLQSIEDNFQNNHLRPVQSRIRDYIDGIFQGKAKKQLGSALNDTTNLFGITQYNAVGFAFRLKCLEDFEKFLKQLINWDDCSSDLEDFESRQTASLFKEIEAVLKEPYRNTSESSSRLPKSIFKAGRNAMNSMFTLHNNPQLIKQEQIPAVIKMIKLLRKQTSWGHIRKSVDTSELSAMNDELETFFQASPHFSNICLIKQEIQRFQVYYKEQSVIKIKNDVAKLLQSRKDWMIKFDQKIAEIVEWVKKRIEDSNVIFHHQEILMCIKMHLIKIVDGHQVCSHKNFSNPLSISEVLRKLEEYLERHGSTPDKLIANVENRLNVETSFIPGRLCLAFDFPKDAEMDEKDHDSKQVNVSDVIKYVSKQLENFKTDPSTLLEAEEILKISCHVLSHCHKIELDVLSDNSNETSVPKFAEFHDQVQNLLTGQLQNCPLAQKLKQFDCLVTAYEKSDFNNVFQGLLNSRQRRFEDLEQKVEFLLKRTQEDLEEIFDVQLKCGKYTLGWINPLKHYNDSIVKFTSSDFEDVTSIICETELFQIYVQSLLKFTYLQDVLVPSSVRTIILELESCLSCKQFQNVFKTILLSSTQIGHWGLPILLLIQKLIMILPEDNCTCQDIHSLAAEINQLAKNIQSAKEQTVLENIMLKLTATSYKCLSKIATERILLDKVHNTLSMVTCRRDIIRQNVFRCELYQKFEAYFQNIPAEVSVVNFYDQVILPMIDIEIVDIFGLRLPSSTIQEHLINLVNSEAKHFYHRNTEILGLVLLNYNLNKFETDFCKTIANCSHSWKPNIEQKKRLINFIESNNPKEMNLKLGENRLVKVFLNDIDIEKKNMNLPFLPSNVLMYLRILIQSAKPSSLPEITEKIKEILVHCCLSEWEFAIKELVKNSYFVRFLNLNVPDDFVESLENVGLQVMEKISTEFDTFRSSYKEIPQNAETLELVSKQFDLQSNTNIRLELKVHEMIRFKHFFNRHFHFKAFEDEDIEILQSFDILYQRFLICHVPFEEFNDLFYRLAEIPSKKLIQTVSGSNAFEFMEAILIELVNGNYSALCERKENADSSYLFDIKRSLVQWKENGSAKRKLLEILADAILLEVECLSGSTTIDLEKVRRAVECIQDLEISTELVNDLHQAPLTIWVRKIRQHKLLETFNSKTADAILKFEDKFGSVTKKLLEICNGQPEDLIFEFVNNFNSCRWDARICQLIEAENDFTNLSAKCTADAEKMQNTIMDIAEISSLMRENPKNCNIMSYLQLEHVQDEESEENCYIVPECLLETDIHEIEKFERGSDIAAEVKKLLVVPDQTILQKLLTVGSNLKTMANYAKQKLAELVLDEEMEGFDSYIYTWDESRIQKWIKLIVSFNDKNDQTKIVTEHLHEVLAVICRGVYLIHKYKPRPTQLISAWLLIQKSFRQKGCLAEIQTGEGKTLIVAMMVIVRVLCGDDVDVITSSPVLAHENLSDVQELYNLFGVTTGTNCDLEAERDEKVRKSRYKSRVIYGDVASFQRDILLTNFFDRDITMGRTTDIVFVDEVDSMLLDKGENILYLSHNIQDLRSLWPIFVEIWNAVHAPDVFRGRPEDVVLVTRFVKHRIQKGDIFFPNSLSKFIKEKLVVWIQNAFLAMNMKENDPYILSDVNKKGPSIVIMDKDTGVEQVNMNWSNGLHQFIQLKHTDRLTSESLKAVFMSNICYFRKFKGKLFGITGTLGSTTESELLSKCYDVDFFAVPRFQSRRCIEDEGFVVQDEFTWIKKIQDIVEDKCLQKRAVLIICENVDSVDKIVKELRPMHSQKVVAYKSSFDEEFRKNKETTPLDSGHILAATNIAGRGTDWRTTTDVEEAGGLHVILSYMPGNVRIEEQAFGRTARKGLPGSVQYVVIHNGPEGTTVNALRRIRDENESKRLDNFRIKSIPRIEIEEKLCERFHETLKIVKSKLNEKDTDVEKLHIENLKNKWAMWLDSMSESLKLVHVKGEVPIIEDFEKFQADMISKAGGVSKFESGPVELIKLGKIYEEKGKFTQAKSYFDKVINSEPNYSEVAHYYKAATILKEKSSGMESKRLAIKHLKSSHRLLKKRMTQLMSSSKILQMTDNIRRQDGMGTMSNRYEKQVENECELYQVYCGKIEEAIGAPITSGILKTVTFVIDDKESTEIFEVLRKNPGVCKNYRLSKKVRFSEAGDLIINDTTISWPPLFMYCRCPVVEFLKKCLQDRTLSGRLMEEDVFCGVFENSIVTRNKFWSFLIQNKVLIHNREEKLIIIRSSPEKFKSVMLPEDMQDYKRIIETILQNNDNEVYDMNLLEDLRISPERLSSIEVELAVAGILCLEHIMVADVNTEFTNKLKWNPIQKSWDGFTPELQQYQDLVEVVIQKYSGKGSKQPVFEDKIRFDEIPLPLDDLTSSKNVWSFLRDVRAIKGVRVNFSLCHAQSEKEIKSRLNQIKICLSKETELQNIFGRYHDMPEIRPNSDHVMEVLVKAVGKIKTLPEIDIFYTPLSDYYKTGAYPPELEDFYDQSFGNILELTEKTHWFDWRAFVVAMFGLLQIAGGICMLVMSGGTLFHGGAFLISEGISDVLFAIQAGYINRNFSWTDYGIHKAISVGISLITMGIGAWCGSGVETARYVGKTAFEILKLAGKDVLKKAGKAVLEFFVDLGFDRVLDYLRETIIANCRKQLDSYFKSDNDALFNEISEVVDQIHAQSYEKGQAERLIGDTFEYVFKNEKAGNFGITIGAKATEISGSVVKILGNCSEIANSKIFANSSNKHLKRVNKVGKVLTKLTKAAAFLQPLLEMATYAKEVLTVLIRSLRATLANLQMQRVDNNGTREDKSTESAFGTYKQNFFRDITEQIINFMATTIQYKLLEPAFTYSARCVVKFLNKKMKKNATNSLRHLNIEKSTTLIKQLQFERKKEVQNRAFNKIKGRATIRELDPHTFLQGSGFTVSTAANLFGDNAVFYEDNKGKFHFGEPTLSNVVQGFGRGTSVSLVELFVCACYFGFILTVEDTTGELNCEDGKMEVSPVSHTGSKRNAQSGFINVDLVYLRNDKDEAVIKPKYKGEVQELEDESEVSRLGLYQSLIFLKTVMRVEGTALRCERRLMMKNACDVSKIARTIDKVKSFIQSNLKDFNIVEHLFEKMSEQNNVGNNSKTTLESVQNLSLDGVDSFEGGYGNGHILRKIQNSISV